MALKRLTINGYGQIELNQVSFPITGRIEAQCKLNATDFAAAPCENGMLVAVDNINREIKLPTASEDLPIGLVYSTEHVYDERNLHNVSTFANFVAGKEDLNNNPFYPRIGYLEVGDKWTSNTLAYDDTEFATEAALKTALAAYKTTRVYGSICTNGAVKLTATKPTVGPVLLVVKYYTMPDGQDGVKFQVIG